MKRTTRFIPLLLCLHSLPLLAADNEFQQFVDDNNQAVAAMGKDFEQYRAELEADFKLYSAAYQQALEQQKQQVSARWGDYRPGDKTHWVEYDDDNVRTEVDFQSGQIDVEILVDKDVTIDQVRQRLSDRVKQLVVTSEADAFKRDAVAQQVEQQLQQSGNLVTSGQPRDVSIIEAWMPEFAGKSPANVNRLQQTLIRKAKVEQRKAPVANKKIIRMRTSAPVNMPERANRYRQTVEKVAEKEQLPLALVFAVIETESSFNPMATSHIPAYGLMQIVPRSAGRDATAYLYGKPAVLAPSYLYNGENNIRIGGAYLHILFHQYLKAVDDPVSRLYCAIAAYNTGAGNVARAFTGNTNINEAAVIINRMTPLEVYNKLRRALPHDETRKYLKNVANRLPKYQG